MSQEVNHHYQPRGACLELFSRRDPEVLVSGPAGTGKSRACMEKVHQMALRNPGMRALMVRKTLSSFTSTGLVTWREHVATEAIGSGICKWYGGSPQEAAQYQYKNGSTVTVGGLDRATRIMSSEYDVIYVQEATEVNENEWETMTTRLRNGKVSFQQIIADCNPADPDHWLKRRADDGQTVMLQSKHEDNPRLVNEDGSYTAEGGAYLQILDQLSGTRFQRLRRGRWVAAEGAIYEDYEAQVHHVAPFGIGKDWPRFWAIDWGFVNPFVCQWWAINPDGQLILYREIYMTKRLVEDHCKKIKELMIKPSGQWREPRPVRIITDHDVECEATLERELGLSVTQAKKDFSVAEGIQAVGARMKAQANGRPQIILQRDCLVEQDEELARFKRPTCTAEEIPGYIWESTPEGKPNKEQPRKIDDHGCDAMRYFVVDQDLGPQPGIRWM